MTTNGLPPGYVQNAALPLDARYFYQLNNVTHGVDAWFDGDVDVPFQPSVATMLLSPHVIVGLIPAERRFVIRELWYYDGAGSFADTPTTFHVLNRETGKPVLIAAMTGDKYQQWIKVVLPQPIPTDKLLITGAGNWQYPTELKLIGDYQAAASARAVAHHPAGAARRPTPFFHATGVNTYWWDYQVDEANPNSKGLLAAKFDRLKICRGGHRIFGDWQQFEPEEGAFAFHPTANGWNHDLATQASHDAGIVSVTALMKVPRYMQQTYPPNTPHVDDFIPVKAADAHQQDEPGAYRNYGRLLFNYAARYGANKHVRAVSRSVYRN